MNKIVMSFLVQLTVDEDHPGVPDIEEVKQQIEHSLLDGSAEAEFGILDATTYYLGSNSEKVGKVE